MFDLNILRQQVQDIGAKASQARAELEKLKTARDEISAAPTSKADALAALFGSIDVQAGRHMGLITEQLGNIATKGNPSRFADMSLLAAAKSGSAATPQSLEAALFLVLGDQMKNAAARLIEKMPWPAGALDQAEKESKLRAVDKRIADSEAELSSLVLAARSAGVNI